MNSHCSIVTPVATNVSLGWSADDQSLFYTESRSDIAPYRVHRFDLNTGIHETITSPPETGKGDYWVSVSSQDDHLLFLRNRDWFDTEIHLLAANAKQPQLILTVPRPLLSVAWGSDSDHLILAEADGALSQVSLSTGKREKLLPAVANVLYPSYQDQSIVFTSGSERQLILHEWNASEAKAEPVANSSRSQKLPRFAHHSDQIAFVSNRTGLPQFWIMDGAGNARQVSNFDRFMEMSQFEWSPDDCCLLSHSHGRVYTINLTDSRITYLTPEGMFARNASWTRDAQHVYFAVRDGQEWNLYQVGVDGDQMRRLPTIQAYMVHDSGRELGILFSKFDAGGIWYLDSELKEQLLIPELSNFDWSNWSVLPNGVTYLVRDSEGVRLDLFDFDSSSVTTIHNLEQQQVLDYAYSNETDRLLYTAVIASDSDIWLAQPQSLDD